MSQGLQPANAEFAAKVRASFARQGFMTTLGAQLTDIAPGRVTIETDLDPRLTQQVGYFHGGVVGALADSAGGYAALSLMPVEAEVVTVEYKINFMRPATGPLLRATGHVLRAGKTVSIARIDCFSGPADRLELCAVLQATFMRVAA